MSGGPVCKCPESKKPILERQWFVTDYKCNYSLFNGGRYQRSDYSAIYCAKCEFIWRTKAAYVDKLKIKSLREHINETNKST